MRFSQVGRSNRLILDIRHQTFLWTDGDALYVVTYVDVFPNFTDETLKALRQFATDSRKDQDSVRFEFLQDVVRTNHFSIVEVWQNRQAYDAHLTQQHSKRFREKIQPGLGSPFDERLYNLVQ